MKRMIDDALYQFLQELHSLNESDFEVKKIAAMEGFKGQFN